MTQWSYVKGACGALFTTPHGIFTSPSYPDNYPDNGDCIYTISQANGTVILLNFLSMDMEGYGLFRDCDGDIDTETWYSDCQYDDYLEIRDGPSNTSLLLGKLCGSEIPAPIQSSQNQMWLK